MIIKGTKRKKDKQEDACFGLMLIVSKLKMCLAGCLPGTLLCIKSVIRRYHDVGLLCFYSYY